MKNFVNYSVDIFSRMLSSEYSNYKRTHIINNTFEVFATEFKIVTLIDNYVASHVKNKTISEKISNKIFNKLATKIC